MESFFKYEGVEILADLAHPTNTFESGSYAVYNSYVDVTINYENYKTVLRVSRTGGLFHKIQVVSDNDWYPPFKATRNIKDLLVDALEEKDKSKLNEFERQLDKKVHEMNGKELSCLLLTISWFNY